MKKCVYFTAAKLSSKKWKKSSFLKKKSLVGLTPEMLRLLHYTVNKYVLVELIMATKLSLIVCQP